MAYTPINKSTDYFFTKFWTGNDTAQTITGIPFAPSFVWIKNRSAAESHTLVDAVRGANNFIKSNDTSVNNTNTEFVKSLTSDGYTLGNADEVNNGSNNIVGWNWKANGQGSSNTDGSINTTYTSANTTSGFSTVKWNGNGSTATIGHGLGKVPKMIIVKSLANTTTWMVQHTSPSMGNAKEIYLNNTTAAGSSTAWNSTTPTSTVFSVTGGGGDGVNASGAYIAYCFAEVKGFSKIGQFAGNGNANGGFIYCGFKPAFFMIKEIQSASDWHISFNNIATQQNPIKGLLYPNSTGTDSNTESVDFLSNGVKIRTSGGGQNESNKDYIYMAYAAAPLVGSNNVPATAR